MKKNIFVSFLLVLLFSVPLFAEKIALFEAERAGYYHLQRQKQIWMQTLFKDQASPPSRDFQIAHICKSTKQPYYNSGT